MRWWRELSERSQSTRITWLLVALICSASACGHGVYHRVRPGESLYRISKAYGVSVDELARVNKLADPSRIEVGQELRIPGVKGQVPVDVVAPKAVSSRATRPDPADRNLHLEWPIDGGTVTSEFGERDSSFHDGIDISAPAGTPVHAALDGEVIYSDILRGYGNVIIVRHPNGYATVYAHNERNLAQAGQRVRRREVIARVGNSGRTSGANLHFEVRRDNVARNPLFFLPASATVALPRGVDTGS